MLNLAEWSPCFFGLLVRCVSRFCLFLACWSPRFCRVRAVVSRKVEDKNTGGVLDGAPAWCLAGECRVDKSGMSCSACASSNIVLRHACASERSEAPRLPTCKNETSKSKPSAWRARNRWATTSPGTTSTPTPTRSRLLNWLLEETQMSTICEFSTSHFHESACAISCGVVDTLSLHFPAYC